MHLVYAYDPIPITYSSAMDHVVIDGKWSFETEWKQSSLNDYYYDDNTFLILRTAHYGEFVYVFIDAISDETPQIELDKAVICFDINTDKSKMAGPDDYCFMVTLGGNATVFQGSSDSSNNFKEIPIPDGFIAVILQTKIDGNILKHLK